MAGDDPYPKGVPRSINYPEIPLYAFLENSARKYPNRVALIFHGKRISYDRLWDETRRFSASLRDLGVRKGDRVGLLMPNTPQFVVAYYATLMVGAVAVAVNPLNPVEEVERELHETGVEALIILDRFIDKMPEERPRNVIVAEAEAYLPQPLKLLSQLRRRRITPPRDALRFKRLLEVPPLDSGEEIDALRDLAVVQYTGGTTGPPKGVMLTHFNLVANALQTFSWLRGWGYSAKPQPAGWPVVVCAVPFFHIYGMTVALNEAIHFGSTLILVPDPQPEAIMRAIHRHTATHLPAIPRIIRGIVDHPRRDRYDLTSLTSCVSGGAAVDPDLVERFVELTGAQFYQGYGLTEAGPVTHCTIVDGGSRPRSVGLPFPDTEAKIMDIQTGEVELSPGEEGELILRGPQVMVGYWRDPEATAKALRESWLHTGDIARIDAKGYLYIVGRKQERIISSGHTVWPKQVEDVIESHPAIESAVALGILDPLRCATDIRAVVTLNPGWNSNEAEQTLIEFCRELLEPYQAPSEIVVVESLPRTPLGKVDRRALGAELDRFS
jgi:long-chain acyl-CoA synthetase